MIEKNPVVFGLLWIAAGALILFWEWRRAARKNRAWRLLSATASLVSLWVFWSTRATPSAASTSQILLYTPSLDTTPAMKPAPGEKVYALPGAQAPDGVTIIPDLGFLWRSNPTLQVLRVAGDGIQKVDTPVPPDVRVVAVAAPLPPRSGRISEVDFPSSINVGDSFKIRGLVQVTPADSNLLIELSEPDGTVSAAQSLGNGTGEFSLDTFPAKTAGNFRWRLTLSRREGTKPMQTLETEEIGMEVRTETPPALLLLESSPRLDTARLRDWYQRMRGKFFSRTQVGKERFQYSAVGMPTPPVIHLSSEFLQQFRVIIIDETSESYLAPDESAALRHGLVEGKLGVLVIGPPAAATAAASSARKLFTGPVVSLPSDDDTLLDRRARLIAVGTARLPAAPVDVENFEITATDAQRILLRDPQERVVAAAGLRQGEGWVARSLVRNTWKWERGGRGRSVCPLLGLAAWRSCAGAVLDFRVGK